MATPSERRFDLVVLDLDGTILDLYHHKPITPVVVDAIAAKCRPQAFPSSPRGARSTTLTSMWRTWASPRPWSPPRSSDRRPDDRQWLAGQAIRPALAQAAAAWGDAVSYHLVLFLAHDGRTLIYQNAAGRADFYDHVFGFSRTMQPSFTDLLARTVRIRRSSSC